jgi:phosphatidate cytidylyltransferase
MSNPGLNYLTSSTDAFAHPVTRWTCIAVGALLLVALPLAYGLRRAGLMSERTFADTRTRTLTWMVIAPLILGAIVWCPLSTMLGTLLIAILCYREYARATGLFRETLLSAIVAAAVLAMGFATVDHWYGLFMAVPPLTMAALAGASVVSDEPSGYIRRVSVAAMGYLLFGAGLLHLGYIANDPSYRPILCMLVLCVQGSDIAAYCCGKAFGKRHLFPKTSPSKTLGGHVGALVLTSVLFTLLGGLVFEGTPLASGWRLWILAIIVAVGAQLGDLVLGSIKRDIGIKDMGHVLPGHGGILDRFNSFVLVAPAAFHAIGYFIGFGLDRPAGVLRW